MPSPPAHASWLVVFGVLWHTAAAGNCSLSTRLPHFALNTSVSGAASPTHFDTTELECTALCCADGGCLSVDHNSTNGDCYVWNHTQCTANASAVFAVDMVHVEQPTNCTWAPASRVCAWPTRIPGQVNAMGVIDTRTTASEEECKALCCADVRCHSIGFAPDNGECLLGADTQCSGPLSHSPRYVYLELGQCNDTVQFCSPAVRMPSRLMQKGALHSVAAETELQCQAHCCAEPGCRSATFSPQDLLCHMSRATRCTEPLASIAGFVYFELEDCATANHTCDVVVRRPDEVLAQPSFASYGPYDEAGCLSLCCNHSTCASVDYYRPTGTCYLKSQHHCSSSLSGGDGYVYLAMRKCGGDGSPVPTPAPPPPTPMPTPNPPVPCTYHKVRWQYLTTHFEAFDLGDSVDSCQDRCCTTPRCVSVSFNTSSGACLLSNTSRCTGGGNATYDEDFIMFEPANASCTGTPLTPEPNVTNATDPPPTVLTPPPRRCEWAKTVEGYHLVGGTALSTTHASEARCQELCCQDARCHSINYRRVGRLCVLNDAAGECSLHRDEAGGVVHQLGGGCTPQPPHTDDGTNVGMVAGTVVAAVVGGGGVVAAVVYVWRRHRNNSAGNVVPMGVGPNNAKALGNGAAAAAAAAGNAHLSTPPADTNLPGMLLPNPVHSPPPPPHPCLALLLAYYPKQVANTTTPVDTKSVEFATLKSNVAASMQRRTVDYTESGIVNGLRYELVAAAKVDDNALCKRFMDESAKIALRRQSEAVEEFIAFHCTNEDTLHIVLKADRRPFSHPFKKSSWEKDGRPVFDNVNGGGVYVSRHADYALEHSSIAPLKPGDTAMVVMFRAVAGKTRLEGDQQGAPGDYDSHMSPTGLEWYLLSEEQACPTFVLTLKAVALGMDDFPLDKAPDPTLTPVEVESDKFKWLKNVLSVNMQHQNDDYVKNRYAMGKKAIRFELVAAEKVYNPTLQARFAIRAADIAADRGVKYANESVSFHGTAPNNLGPILQQGLLPFRHSLNKCLYPADKGYFGDNTKGVYVSPYADYTLKYSNGLRPLEPEETATVIMFRTVEGKSRLILTQEAIAPTEGYDSHTSPTALERYLFSEAQLCPTYVVTLRAVENNQTLADDKGVHVCV